MYRHFYELRLKKLMFIVFFTCCSYKPLIFQELPQEAKRFARTDKSWTKLMKRDFETRNVLQV